MVTARPGALYGLAIGDALGCHADALPGRDHSPLGALLPGFEPARPVHPIAAGMPAGAVTDDTEQAVLLARLLVKDRGRIDPHDLAGRADRVGARHAARGSLDLLAPPPSAPSPPSWPACPRKRPAPPAHQRRRVCASRR